MAEAQFVAGEVDYPELPETVARTMEELADLVAELDRRYAYREAFLRDHTLPLIAWVGHGRAGKDEAGAWLGQHSKLIYGGSVSRVLLPFIAHALDLPLREAWLGRHEKRKYWFQFANLMRVGDPCRTSRWNLANADMIVGTRAKPELLGCLQSGVITHAVWIDNPRVEPDPTVEFAMCDCTHVVTNHGSLAEYHANLAEFCKTIGIQIKD